MNIHQELIEKARERRRRMGFVETRPVVVGVKRPKQIEVFIDEEPQIKTRTPLTTAEHRRAEKRKEITALSKFEREKEINARLSAVVSIVCEHYNIEQEELLGHGQVKTKTVPRHVAFWLSVKIAGISHKRTGQFYSRDHATVLSAVDVMQARIADTPAVRLSVVFLSSVLADRFGLDASNYWGA